MDQINYAKMQVEYTVENRKNCNFDFVSRYFLFFKISYGCRFRFDKYRCINIDPPLPWNSETWRVLMEADEKIPNVISSGAICRNKLELITTRSKRRRLLWCAVFDQSSEFLRPLQLLCVNRTTSGEAIKTSPILVTSAAAQLGSVSDEFLFLSIEDILLWESTLANGV